MILCVYKLPWTPEWNTPFAEQNSAQSGRFYVVYTTVFAFSILNSSAYIVKHFDGTKQPVFGPILHSYRSRKVTICKILSPVPFQYISTEACLKKAPCQALANFVPLIHFHFLSQCIKNIGSWKQKHASCWPLQNVSKIWLTFALQHSSGLLVPRNTC